MEKACKLLETDEIVEDKPSWIVNSKKEIDPDTRTLMAKILYFKGYCYYKLNDYDKAIEKFKICYGVDMLDEMKSREALLLIWKSKTKPSLPRWWWSTPICPWPKRIIFFTLLLLLFGLILVHPFIEDLLSPKTINWTIYIILILAVLATLVLPQIEKVKMSEIEFSLVPEATLEPVLSPIKFEEQLKQISKEYTS